MLSKTQIRAIIACIIVVVCFVIVMISGYLFSTFNCFKAGYAVCRTFSDSKSITELNDGIYMVGSGVKLQDFFEDMGYTDDPSQRMGAVFAVSKDGEYTSATMTHNNKYYYIVEIDT